MGSCSWTKWWPAGAREAVPHRTLGLAQRGGRRERREMVADGNTVRRCRGRVLIVTWTNEIVAGRVGGKVLSKVEAEGEVVRRSGGGDLYKAGTEGKTVKRSGGDSEQRWRP